MNGPLASVQVGPAGTAIVVVVVVVVLVVVVGAAVVCWSENVSWT